MAAVTRSCPTCRRQYPDAAFFCGLDGAITIQDQDAHDLDPRLGKRLGEYVLAARVADGAMGRVYEGRHHSTKERVAIKVLHASVMRDRVALERFRREYESARELSHRYVVRMLAFVESDPEPPFLVMEFLEGEELGKLLAGRRPLTWGRVVRILSQTALALERAHGFGFVHRDLKPENIFLCRTEAGDDVRVLDFGSVKLQVETGAKLTAVGTTVGSPFYMSPEQAMGRTDVDPTSDVFALGAITYEMLTREVAFEAPNVAKILLRIMNDHPVPASQRCWSLPKAVDRVLEKALAKAKAERHSSAREFVTALGTAFGLTGSLEQWAVLPQPELEAALEAAGAVQELGSNQATVRMQAPDAGIERGAVSLKLDTSPPPGPRRGAPRAVAWIVAFVVVAGGVLALLLR